jgi:hypothetical protein
VAARSLNSTGKQLTYYRPNYSSDDDGDGINKIECNEFDVNAQIVTVSLNSC